MKILYISAGNLPDFQADMVFLGGRYLFGADFVDANKNWYSYKEDKEKYWRTRVPDGGNSYGKGFTLHGRLDDIQVDRTDLEAKIKNRYFDYVIYGSVSRGSDYINLVAENYPRDRVIFIDGEDDMRIRMNLLPHGLYFKRELTEADAKIPGVFPINFCVPRACYVDRVPNKSKMYAHIIPGDISTYIYGINDEVAYHKDYQDSHFAVTMKKAGWDCCRHYEILMNGCVPYFLGLENCPNSIMVPLPKEKLISIRKQLEAGVYEKSKYHADAEELLEYSKKHLTSEALVERILSIRMP